MARVLSPLLASNMRSPMTTKYQGTGQFAIWSLTWLSTQTRPDISKAVRALARYCPANKIVHWRAALGILRYQVRIRWTSLFGTSVYRGARTVRGLSVLSLADADYAGTAADGNAVPGGLVICGGVCAFFFCRTFVLPHLNVPVQKRIKAQ